MTNAANYRLLASLLTTTVLTGYVWKSDYDALQAAAFLEKQR